MIEIIYCEEELFDLPPPTLFYRATGNGLELLTNVVKQMLMTQSELCLNEYDFIKLTNIDKKIIFKPFGGQLTLKITESQIITDISQKDWIILLDAIQPMIHADNSMTYFVEFDGYGEDGNFIIES